MWVSCPSVVPYVAPVHGSVTRCSIAAILYMGGHEWPSMLPTPLQAERVPDGHGPLLLPRRERAAALAGEPGTHARL